MIPVILTVWTLASVAVGYLLCRWIVHPLVERSHAMDAPRHRIAGVVGVGEGGSVQDHHSNHNGGIAL
jgi:hypothetical protein